MSIQYFADPQVETLKTQLSKLEHDNSVNGILILACDNNHYDSIDLNPFLKSFKKPVFGGIFPAIIYNEKKYESGFITATFDKTPVVNIIERISTPDTNFDKEILEISETYSDTETMFIFIDGFAKRIGAFIESIFTIFGLEFNYIGGGAGSLSLKQKPCIICNKGLKEDCAITIGVELESGIGVKHGWEPIAGPFKVTQAEKTIIKELEFRPAFNLYRDVVEQHSKQQISPENFFEIAKAYPFGINKIDAETVVRDPLFIGENNSLICVGEVAAGSYINILTGNKDMLVKAAGEAVQAALRNMSHKPEKFMLFIDCISRVLFLEENFDDELEEVLSNYNQVPLIGALTIGEIANNGKDYLEFYNKTSVIGCF